ncbi:uncharacterized protein I303_104354 [Kwoniella dejecticola CBS 10117]|uniref:Transcription elongation regulator 1 n=1 Tax=Kwoniella dejecticola CBS 10117 TaxID=1296121 RepID=A0A1A6A5K5_9TREE|nr:transcription elongation regulator 1 [Kwoniella dejecticola CBS 10117]OBR85336.1 transcription elongation regulator 1 [Kwoniella dejecticola CBS 10117]
MSGVPPGPPPGPPPSNNTVARPPGPPPGGPPGQSFRPPPLGFPPGPPMGLPPNMPNFPPPLPAGWSEHRAPDGVTPYFYNSHTRESTYIRPTLFPPFPPPGITPNNGSASPATPAEREKKKKKEKPRDKVAIPGTTWTRVTTTEGNVFYFEKESKKSEWSVPEEIKDAVEALEAEEKAAKEQREREEKQKAEEERLERLREVERIRLEIEEEKKLKQVELEKKRKEREEQAEDRQSKIPKTENGDAEEDDNQENVDADQDEQDEEEENGEMGPQDAEDEAAWMRAVAAEFAEADQQLEEGKQKTAEEIRKEEEEAAKKVFAVPEKVQVSPEEGRALFKALLIEKDVNPFSTWEAALPTFINDPRYVLLSSQKERQEVYDEYCRDVGRARRLAKSSTASGSGSTDKKKNDPEKEYKALLREEVTSTRTRWDDFRKKWKKDRKFYAYGRDDRDREKMFKTHLRELGERKRADAQRAEQDFYDLLKESDDITSSSVWSDVKKTIYKDSRYDAVGSSSLREELFNNHIKNLASSSNSNGDAAKDVLSKEEQAARKSAERKAKAEASLKERENKIRQERSKIEFENNKSRIGAGKEEAERLFGSLLVDQVRDHHISWNEASQFLSSDPRFNNPSLHPRDKQRLFSQHIEKIASKRSNELHGLFETHTPSLDTQYDDVYPKIVEDPTIKRLGLQGDALEDQWKAWMRSRESQARIEFDQMLGENSFIEFWGTMRKKTLDEDALNIKTDDQFAEAEGLNVGGDDEEGKKDITDMAKQIDLAEIKAVLRRDKRYRQFDHVPEKRESWLRDYLENLEAASGSKTIHNVGFGR